MVLVFKSDNVSGKYQKLFYRYTVNKCFIDTLLTCMKHCYGTSVCNEQYSMLSLVIA